MGITPGGATPASFMSYGLAKRFSKRGDNFGKGEIEGVVAPETAAHAAGTSALLPMLTLGIPGSPTAAVLLGGLMIWGLQPGPMLFIEQKDFVWGLIASMYLGNIAGLIVVLTCVPLFAAILRVPFSIIAPIILVICAVGAYTVHNSMFDVWMMMVFGVVGYVFTEARLSAAAAGARHRAGRQGRGSRSGRRCSARQGSLTIFWSNWLVGSIMTLGVILLFWPIVTWLLDRRRSGSVRAGALRPPAPPSSTEAKSEADAEARPKQATKEETMRHDRRLQDASDAARSRHRLRHGAGRRGGHAGAGDAGQRPRPGSRPSPCSSSSPPAPAAAPTRWRASSRAWSPRTT